ncbi:RNA 2'-phosphotransferase [Caulobacter sp. 17J65-9]|uniref:RNA 2'-phosphotransferase n=1 Tax=Caulobacter sp. 17J65-9 TaxID=2709382 RepID=UPI0013CDA295|nr:RNA 2'-phosphotransferase [Caulobacter sp. 17J65-9]NEX92934.1 RNA 2'-phosphotransferase [Caulobacter sp. 17J65-9]
MSSDVAISKTLSFWLRHKPEAAGLTLEAAGWAEVDAVLAALQGEGLQVDWERLVEVVERNDKQRFELSSDASKIRARQGHSVEIVGDWPRAAPPAQLYHGTVERFLAPILAEGLKAGQRHHVHLSPDLETAQVVGRRRGAPIVLVVDAERLAADGGEFFLTGNGVWLIAHVPSEYLSRA